ncbi:hypothetical protein [Massilia sp. TN1-12]|uniref:hypothetical protein n=1 Tax=Massilia paldalensis TaxID=3377675 RepID=UPI00384D3A76
MAKTNTAAFAQTPKTATAVATGAAANIGTDAPTNVVQLMQAGPDGCIVTRLTAEPRATLTGPTSLILLLAKSADSYATMRLIDSVTMPTQTLSTAAGITKTYFGDFTETTPLRLEAGDRLYFGSQVALAGGIVCRAEYTDF